MDDSGENHSELNVKEYDSVEYFAHPENREVATVRQTGFDATSGDQIQFLDDDWLYQQKIKKQVYFRWTSAARVVYFGLYDNGSETLPEHGGEVLDEAWAFSLPRCNTLTRFS